MTSDTIEQAARLLAVSYCRYDREGWYDAAQEMSRTVLSQAADIARLTAALANARRAMICQVTGISDGITIYQVQKWIAHDRRQVTSADG